MYRDNLLFILSLIYIGLAGCASPPLRLPVSGPEPAATATTGLYPADRASVVAMQALAHLGVPYRSGGLSPRTGFDCSGLVVYVYRVGADLALPRNTFDLSRRGEPVERDDLMPGDLVFYNTQRRAYSHVGIYLGEGRFIHAPSSGGEVRVESLHAGYWARRYSGARRVLAPSG